MTSTSTTFSVINPADNTLLAHVEDMGISETRLKIKNAETAFHQWKVLSSKDRARALEKWYNAICNNEAELARTITLEQGKPLSEAIGEVRYGASYIKWFAEEARRIDGSILNGTDQEKRLLVTREPVGVVAAITPWNFPMAMITRKVAAALAAGCSIIVKPAAETPLTALALQNLAVSVGIPDDVFSLITTTKHVEVGLELTKNPTVRKLTFTGSTATGRTLMEQSASTVKRLSLELGGNAPFIVFNDANIDDAVEGAIKAKFRNAGQTCVCANRFLIQRDVFDVFQQKLSQATSALKVGNGLTENVQIGPLISTKAVEKVSEMVNEAISNGAKILVGGAPSSTGSNFFPPTVMTDINLNMRIAQEEIFGPVVALMPFDTEEEAIHLANSSESGLAAYVYTENYRRIHRVTEALEYGMIGVNEGIISTEVAPFGGVKQSGFGREGSRFGLDDYLSYKYICVATS